MDELCYRLKDLENKERHMDCQLDRSLVESALSDMDVDLANSLVRLTADVSCHNVTALCTGQLTGVIRIPCQRCLGPAEVFVQQPLHTVFVPPSAAIDQDDKAGTDEDFSDEDDLDYAHHDGEVVDLTPILREYLVLAIPITVYCKEDCRGLCPSCGADRNLGDCSCQPAPKMSPFATLRDMKL
ncbi:MAG TPA: DUF177 domain-containing protein [Pseudomonadota bacterium]|nr:DUF177 domain-containing protein [Pseudomonadota bacterium]